MEELNKIKLSSNFIFVKVLLLCGLCFSLVVGPGQSKNDAAVDFKTGLEYKIFLFVCIALLVYFFTRPKIYYDEARLYIKKINQPEIVIPLKNVTSFFENPLSVNRGTANFTIAFKGKSSEDGSIRFTTGYSSNSIKEFKVLIKKINPHVEIV